MTSVEWEEKILESEVHQPSVVEAGQGRGHFASFRRGPRRLRPAQAPPAEPVGEQLLPRCSQRKGTQWKLPTRSSRCGKTAAAAVQSLSHVELCDAVDHGPLRSTRLPCPSPSPGKCSNPCPLSLWGYSTILSSVAPFSSCLQPFPASRTFPVSRLFSPGGQSIGASASASVLPVNVQDWFLLGLTGLISLQSKWLSRVFTSTTVQRHQFFSAQPSLLPTSYIRTWKIRQIK